MPRQRDVFAGIRPIVLLDERHMEFEIIERRVRTLSGYTSQETKKFVRFTEAGWEKLQSHADEMVRIHGPQVLQGRMLKRGTY